VKTLRYGDNGTSVVYLQERLGAHGFGVEVDGEFGLKTRARVEQFQATRHLRADGVVGDKTWDALQVVQSTSAPDSALEEEQDELWHRVSECLNLIRKEHREAVSRALSYGLTFLNEVEEPYGSNDGPGIHDLVKHYNQYWWNMPEEYVQTARKRGFPLEGEVSPAPAWCGMLVSNCIREGLGLPYWDYQSGYAQDLEGHPFKKFFGGASQIENWGKDRRRQASSDSPLPGDIFTMGRSASGSDATQALEAGHTGFVLSDQGRYVCTLEGNISNGVFSRTRKKTSLRWFIRWW